VNVRAANCARLASKRKGKEAKPQNPCPERTRAPPNPPGSPSPRSPPDRTAPHHHGHHPTAPLPITTVTTRPHRSPSPRSPPDRTARSTPPSTPTCRLRQTSSVASAIDTGCAVNRVRAARRIIHAYRRVHLSISSDHTIHLPISFDHENRTIRAEKWSELIGRRKMVRTDKKLAGFAPPAPGFDGRPAEGQALTFRIFTDMADGGSAIRRPIQPPASRRRRSVSGRRRPQSHRSMPMASPTAPGPTRAARSAPRGRP
jgi:hypothetical protein